MHRIKKKIFTWKRVGKRPSGAYCRKIEAEFSKVMGAVPLKYETSASPPSAIVIDNDFDDIPVLEDIDTSDHDDNIGAIKICTFYCVYHYDVLQFIVPHKIRHKCRH